MRTHARAQTLKHLCGHKDYYSVSRCSALISEFYVLLIRFCAFAEAFFGIFRKRPSMHAGFCMRVLGESH